MEPQTANSAQESERRRLSQVSVGVIGAGGLGSTMIEGLARLGVRHFTLIDPDVAELSNINRVSGMTLDDGRRGVAKVEIAARNIRSIIAEPYITPLQESVFSPASIHALKQCDLLVVATDNHATRLEIDGKSRRDHDKRDRSSRWRIDIRERSGGQTTAQAEPGEQANAIGNQGNSTPEVNRSAGHLLFNK